MRASLRVTTRGGRLGALVPILILTVALIALLPAAAVAKGGYSAVKIKASEMLVDAGTTVDIAAQINGAAVGDAVELQAFRSSGWVTVATGAVRNPSGRVGFSIRVDRNTRFRAVWVNHATRVASKDVWVKVMAVLTVRATPGAYDDGVGTPMIISGMLKPASDGQVSIRVMRWEDGGWVSAAAFLVDLRPSSSGTSLFAYTWKYPAGGDYLITARIGKTDEFFADRAWTTISF